MTLQFINNDIFNIYYDQWNKGVRIDAMVNPCNTHGAAGAGLSREFQKRYSTNFKAYRTACDKGHLVVGNNLCVKLKDESTQTTPRYIINMATKRNWRDPSRISWVESGFKDLVLHNVPTFNLKTILMPRVGCGLGKLDWLSEIKPLMYKYFEQTEKVHVIVADYEYVKPEKKYPRGFL